MTDKPPDAPTIKRAAGALIFDMHAPGRDRTPAAAERAAGSLNKRRGRAPEPKVGDPDVRPDDIVRWYQENADVTVPEMLEAAIKWTLQHAPTNFDPRQWAIAMGVLMDKWLLINNKPTQRLESILSGVLPEGMTQKDVDAVIREAQSILDAGQTAGGGVGGDGAL